MLKHRYVRTVPNGFGSGIVIYRLLKTSVVMYMILTNYYYRGIAISPFLSKVFELCLLDILGSFLGRNRLQIGFKKNVGCGPGHFLVQNTIDYFC